VTRAALEPFSPSLFTLGKDLGLDIGRAWIQAGLTLPNWPRIVVGYEHQYRDGSKSMLSWGEVSPSGEFGDPSNRNIYPAFQDIDEHTDVFQLGLSYDVSGFHLEDTFRAELHSSEIRRKDALLVSVGAPRPDLFVRYRERRDSTQIANSAVIQKELFDWWLAGVGYRYSWYDADEDIRLTTVDGTGQPAAGSDWSTDKILLNEVWHIANFNSQFRILPKLTAPLGVQGEWKWQDTFGDVNLDEVIDPADPTAGVFRFPATERSEMDQTTAEQSAGLRYSGLPFTTFFADARLKEEEYSRDLDQLGTTEPGLHDVSLASDADVLWQDYRVGFNTAPWTRVSFGGHYRYRDRKTDYDYGQVSRDLAYPGFILERGIVADEVEARLVMRPMSWLKTTLTYRWNDSDYRTRTAATSSDDFGDDATPGGELIAGRFESHTVSASAALTPIRRVNLATTLSYQTSRTTTADNGSLSVAPYDGHLWSLLTSASWTVDDATTLFGSYYFSLARYGQNNWAAGLPLGVDYDRHGFQVGVRRALSKATAVRLQYGYYSYDEPTTGHLLDYTAHQVMAVVDLRF
jgi:hypothetical protein